MSRGVTYNIIIIIIIIIYCFFGGWGVVEGTLLGSIPRLGFEFALLKDDGREDVDSSGK